MTHAVRGLRQVLLLLFCVLNTPLFYYFVLARIANESCDSCRAGATTSPLIIILCSQHTAFYYFVLARIANESCDSCRAGATTSPLIILCSQHTAFLLFCVGTHCQQVMRLMPCGGYDKSSYYYFVFSTHCFLLFVLARFANESCDSCRAGATISPLIIICVCNTPLFIISSSYYYFVFATHRFFIISSIPCQECDSAGFPL